jgi:uncharacterized repeat protein (TIGR03803 family)
LEVRTLIQRIAAFVAAALAVAGCARLEGSNGLPASEFSATSRVTRDAAGFKTIFTFNGTDGNGPQGAMTAVDGVLYGTTAGGGKYDRGVVFRLKPSGSEKVVHDFNTDGRNPTGSLLALKGILYGTTSYGGKKDSGTIFAMQLDGKHRWSYDFKGGWDGDAPNGGLVELKGALYGTTVGGGNYYKNAGCFYRVTLSGKETVLRAFDGGPNGGNPNGDLVVYKNGLYGTTFDGVLPSNAFGGTVFRLTSSGGETVLHRFVANNDASNPEDGLVLLNGVFYGTAQTGGKYGLGAVFSITPAGKERVLHSFGNGSDGSFPQEPLVAYNGNLYGTTPDGGTDHYGTVFEVTPSGKETVLYNFTGGADGGEPKAGLVVLNGTLYGTTTTGASSNYGTAFALTPTLPRLIF